MQRLLDDALNEVEELRGRLEEVEVEADRLRMHERTLRMSSATPCEQVNLVTWATIDRLKLQSLYIWRDKNDDFPAPVGKVAKNVFVYDLSELRAWKKAYDEGKAAHRAKMWALRREATAFMDEHYCFEEC